MDCTKHPGSPITAVCVTCSTILVCMECITDEQHKGHVFQKLQEAANDTKEKLKEKRNAHFITMAAMESDLNKLQTFAVQLRNGQKVTIKEINDQREGIIMATNDIADNLISLCEAQTESSCSKLESAAQDISTTRDIESRYIKDVDNLISEKDDIKVLQGSQKLITKDPSSKKNHLPDLDIIKFTPGTINTKQLKIMFGSSGSERDPVPSLQGAQAPTNMTPSTYKGSEFVGSLVRHGKKVVFESSFKHKHSPILNMSCGSPGKVCIRCENETEINLTDIKGYEVKTFSADVAISGMTIVDADTLLICGRDTKDIRKLSLSTGNVTLLFPSGELHPRDICIAPGGDLLVTLMDTVEFYVTVNSERVLVRYSPQGQERARARHDCRGDALFVRPYRVRFNTTGTAIGVTNSTDKDNKHLVLLNTDLTLRSRYLGYGRVVDGKEKFDTTTYKPDKRYFINDFVFDELDNIIICERFSRSVQLLSGDCVPIIEVLPAQPSAPRSIARNGKELWIGFSNGTVMVYKYH